MHKLLLHNIGAVKRECRLFHLNEKAGIISRSLVIIHLLQILYD